MLSTSILNLLVSTKCSVGACGGKWSTTTIYCDTKTADGGWTVIQRRVDGSVDFNRSWSDYEKGFGDLNGEFWYGLKSMNCLTKNWQMGVKDRF